MCWRKGGDKLLITRKSNPVTATNCQDHLANWCALLLDASRAGLQHPAAPPPRRLLFHRSERARPVVPRCALDMDQDAARLPAAVSRRCGA